ncbi:MAG: UDP-N-acetylmuramate dehydrogenase [Oscillospiraceae bacterium]|jgi:UDP-N-acetylmuramate dehydrogenase|nr:UDP-N-acetylmuramate dehydrogenase [Oscillospiraceae bacterium]
MTFIEQLSTVKIDEPMSEHSSFKIGGKADYYIEVESVAALQHTLNLCKEFNIPYFIIGNGSNLLISDAGIEGLVIRLTGAFTSIELLDGNRIKCGAGALLSKLCAFALSNSLSGLEFAWGIPGSAGGAAFMNAGAYGGEMKQVLIGCEHIDTSGKLGSFTAEELQLSYRHSIYSENKYIITSLLLELKQGEKEAIKAEMEKFMGSRKEKQPLEFPSAGSVFKRPEGYFAGTMIQECGLKGASIGGAQVSEKHAGFIINKGGASCRDVEALVQKIQDEVKAKKGVCLECEIRKVGR